MGFIQLFVGKSKLGFPCHDTTKGSWSEAESGKISTWHKLEAVRMLVEHSKESLEGQSVVIYTNSKNVSSILNVGSRVSELQENTLKIHGTCRDKHINLIPRWRARQLSQAILFGSTRLDWYCKIVLLFDL